MGFSIRGNLLIGNYSYITCTSDDSDTIGDIRVYANNAQFIIEKCISASATKGLGDWEETFPSEVDPVFTAWRDTNITSDYTIPAWLGENLTTSPISILYSNVDDYITYVLSQGGTMHFMVYPSYI